MAGKASTNNRKQNASQTKRNGTSAKRNSSRGSVSGGNKPSKKNLSSSGETRATRKPVPEQNEEPTGIFNDRIRRDISGIVVAVIAVILFVCAVMPVSGVVSKAVSNALHLCLGIGAYILPLFLLGFAVSLFFRHKDETLIARIALGLLIIFIALLGLLALFTPGSGQAKINALFNPDYLIGLGGYIGAGLTWCGLTLFGSVITAIIHCAVIVVGLAIIGLSVSRLIEIVQEKQVERKKDSEDYSDEFAAPPYARVRTSQDVIPRSDGFYDAATAHNVSGESNFVPLTGTFASQSATRKIGNSNVSSATRKLFDSEKPSNSIAFSPEHADDTSNFAQNLETIMSEEGPVDEQGVADSSVAPATPVSTASRRQKKAKKKAEPSASEVSSKTENEGYFLPDMSLLNSSPKIRKGSSSESVLKDTAASLQGTLEDFGILAHVVGWVAGPTVTLFKVELPAGVRVSRVTALNDDIALALAAPGVRIFAPIPGTNYVGIEVPNAQRQGVLLGDVLPAAEEGPLQVAIGKDVEGNCIVSDLAKMPHLLIGGTTGSGKSVCINSMIMSILMRATPDEVRLILIDPKRVEFTPYNDIPHLYVPVVTEPKEAASALSWGVAEMERRLKVFSKVGARNISQYNSKVQSGDLTEEADAAEFPYIVIVIDELADLMMNVGKEVEFSISRIAQLARAAGIHLIVATQRPSANVVTGLIKANITNRIAFNVASSIDSRVILDTPGAESLIGLGDLLLSKPELSKPQRIQGCYVTEDEINEVVEFLKEQEKPEYHNEILTTNLITLGSTMPDGSGGSSSNDDPLVWEAAEMVVSSGLGSTSNIQRRLKVGYSRAGRIMDLLEDKGIVGPPNGSKPREVLVDEMELETLKAFELNEGSQTIDSEE